MKFKHCVTFRLQLQANTPCFLQQISEEKRRLKRVNQTDIEASVTHKSHSILNRAAYKCTYYVLRVNIAPENNLKSCGVS